MTHAEAIAEAIAIYATWHASRGRPLSRAIALFNLHSVIRIAERQGFEQGDLVRETMKTTRAGHGYPFPPAHRLKAAERAEVVEQLAARGIAAELKKIDRAWCLTFGEAA